MGLYTSSIVKILLFLVLLGISLLSLTFIEKSYAISQTTQATNVQFDFTLPNGTSMSGVILTLGDYQHLVVIKDPRTILSNVSQTNSTINNDLVDLIRYQNNLPPIPQSENTQTCSDGSTISSDQQCPTPQQQKPHDQRIDDKIKEILSSTTINFDSKDDVNILIYKGKAFEAYASQYPEDLVQSYHYFDRALQLDPNNVEAQTEKDKVYNTIYDLASGLQQDDDKLQKNPNDLGALSSKRDILLQLQKYDEYMVICNKASQMYMKISNALQLPCELNVDMALHKYDDVLKLTENMQIGVGGPIIQIIPLYNLGKYDTLLTYLDTGIAIGPNSQGYGDNNFLLLVKAATLEKMGKNDQANAMYSAIGPIQGQQSLDVTRGSTYFYLRDYDKAVYYLEKSKQSDTLTNYMKVIAYDEIAKKSALNKIQNMPIQSSQATTSQFTLTQQDIENIDQARANQTIAAEVNIGVNQSTTTIDNNVSVQTTSNTPDSLNVNVSASSQTGPKVIAFNLEATTINVQNLKDLGVMYDGKPISPAPNIDAILHAKSTDNPSFAIIVTQSGVQVLVLVPHFSTHSITITNMSKVIPAIPEFGSIIGMIITISVIGSMAISRRFT